MATSYRDTCPSTKVIDSSDEGELENSSSDSDGDSSLWKKKRSRPARSIIQPTTPINGVSQIARTKRSKNVNIWGSVLTEQTSNDISSSLGAVGVQHFISRGPESFDISAAYKDGTIPRHLERQDSSELESEEGVKEEYDSKQKIKNASKESMNNNRKRKRVKKKSKNNNIPCYEPGQSVTLNKRCELSDTDPVDKVSEEIAFRLWERKKDLIRTLTETLGVPKAIDFCNKTEDLEKSGGLLTLQGIRRRTPGGTFIYLIRNDPSVDQEPIKRVFAMESEREHLQWEKRKLDKKLMKEENIADTQTPTLTSEVQNGAAMDCTSAAPVYDSKTDVKLLNIQSLVGDRETLVGKSSLDPEQLSEGEIVDSNDESEPIKAEFFG